MEILTDYPERLEEHEFVYLAYPETPDQVREFPLEKVRPHKGILLIKLEGCEDRNMAEEMRDMIVQIPLEEAVPLEEGEYYYFQVIGMEVVTEEGEPLGQVTAILETRANDVYVVQGPKGEVLLPASEEVVLDIDVEEGRLVVHLLPGLIKEDG